MILGWQQQGESQVKALGMLAHWFSSVYTALPSRAKKEHRRHSAQVTNCCSCAHLHV